MPKNYEYPTARSSDRDVIDAFVRIADESGQTPWKATLTVAGHEVATGAPEAIRADETLVDFFDSQVAVAHSLKIEGKLCRITVTRHNDKFIDTVTVHAEDGFAASAFARLAAISAKHLSNAKLFALSSLVGEEAQRHFEARDVALARLERALARAQTEIEEGNRRLQANWESKLKELDDETHRRQAHFDEQCNQRTNLMDEQFAARTAELDKREQGLKEREEAVQAAATSLSRKQQADDLKQKFEDWANEFTVTKGTEKKSYWVIFFSSALIVLMGAAIWYYGSVAFEGGQELAVVIIASIKQAAAAAVLVSTVIYLIRWSNSWFQQHAREEFRHKRMQIDFARANWFIDTATQWAEHGQAMPSELVEQLTRNLFLEPNEQPAPSHTIEDALREILATKGKARIQSPGGGEIEIERTGGRVRQSRNKRG